MSWTRWKEKKNGGKKDGEEKIREKRNYKKIIRTSKGGK